MEDPSICVSLGLSADRRELIASFTENSKPGSGKQDQGIRETLMYSFAGAFAPANSP
jgi:hypothetical protein